jgi:ABC-type multidrug transport system ATPase subunit
MAVMSWVIELIGNFSSQVATLNQVLAELNGQQIVAGLNAIVGDEGSGKTLFLRELCEAHPDALWLDTRLPEHDQTTPKEFWALLKSKHTHWNDGLSKELSLALDLHDHLGKQLYMLSTGSRRKVALISLLASGSQFICLDQPFVALDQASITVLCDFLNDMADDPSRAWLVADYEADARIDWGSVINLSLS